MKNTPNNLQPETVNMMQPASNTKYIILGVVVFILLISIAVFALNKPENKVAETKSEDSSMMKKDQTLASSMEKTDGAMMKTETGTQVISQKSGVYTTYSPDLLQNAETRDVVIFFNASWCPTCQAIVKEIKSDESKIPANLTLLSADYDKELDLRKKYGVTVQHTFVKVDKNGNQLKKSTTLEDLGAIIDFAK